MDSPLSPFPSGDFRWRFQTKKGDVSVDSNQAKLTSKSLEDFNNYVTQRGITVSPHIRPHVFPGHGLGIVATGPIEAGTEIVEVPISEILQVSADWNPAHTRDMTAYGRYANFLCRYEPEPQQGGPDFGPWLKTWPRLEDLDVELPLLWPEAARERQRHRDVEPKVTVASTYFTILPWTLTGLWSSESAGGDDGDDGDDKGSAILSKQLARYNTDRQAVDTLLASGSISSREQQRDPDFPTRFLHAWLMTNTRCFHYVPASSSSARGVLSPPLLSSSSGSPSPPPPPPPAEEVITTNFSFSPPTSDSDEAMILCPYIDLFNHSTPPSLSPSSAPTLGCHVAYTAQSYTVTTRQAYAAGSELFTSYGTHTNDTLWAEYGFVPGAGANGCDALDMTAAVARDLNATQRRRLAGAGYGGGFVLDADGVCWRTEVAARLLVMTPDVAAWERFVASGGDEERDEDEGEDEAAGAGAGAAATTCVRGWISRMLAEAQNSIRGLAEMHDREVERVLGRTGELTETHAGRRAGTPTQKAFDLRRGKARQALALRRWEQIATMCESAMRAT